MLAPTVTRCYRSLTALLVLATVFCICEANDAITSNEAPSKREGKATSTSRLAFDLFTTATIVEDGADNETAWEKVKSLQCFFLQKDVKECTSTIDIDGETILCSYCELSKEGMNDAGLNDDSKQICVPSFASQTLLDKNKVTACASSPLPVVVSPPIDLPTPPVVPPITNTPIDTKDDDTVTEDSSDLSNDDDDDSVGFTDGNVTSVLNPNITSIEDNFIFVGPHLDDKVSEKADEDKVPKATDALLANIIPVIANDVPAIMNITSLPPPPPLPATKTELAGSLRGGNRNRDSASNIGEYHPPLWMSNRPLMKILWPRIFG